MDTSSSRFFATQNRYCLWTGGPAESLLWEETVLTRPAILALEDGSVFKGIAIGADGTNSRWGSIQHLDDRLSKKFWLTLLILANLVTLTYPHIGNTGINSEILNLPLWVLRA